jgi:hypothetical protein
LYCLVSLFLLGTFAPPGLFAPAQIPARPTVLFDPVPLNSAAPGQRRVGPLIYLGGWSIRSDDPRFGGLSAMHVAANEVLAVSDAGSILRFPLPGREGRLTIAPLAEGPGPIAQKRNRDAEAMVVRDGKVWISFEHHNQVWRYGLSGWRAEASAEPAALGRWNRKAGGEAMVPLADGRFILFSEGQRLSDGTTEAMLFDGDPALEATKAVPVRYRAPDDYRITDAVQLPDGRILFLNRRVALFEGFSAKLSVGELPILDEGALLSGKEIATFMSPTTTDNMEALSVTREKGRTIVWIASDDNFGPLQRTLLLKFALDD